MAMATHRVQVLNLWVSMFGMRVLIALKEKGVAYEVQEEDLRNKSKLLLELNPIYKKIPVLIHNGRPICESSIIVQYIDEVWPSASSSILPKDPYKRAIARFWVDYIDKKMYDAGDRIIKSREGEQREQAKRDLLEVVETLDKALPDVSGGGPFFGGHHIGFVDIAFAPFLCWFEAYESMGEFKIWEGDRCPHLAKWAESVKEVPSMKEVFSIAPSDKVKKVTQFIRNMFFAASDISPSA